MGDEGGEKPSTPIAQGYVQELIPIRILRLTVFRLRGVEATLNVIACLECRVEKRGEFQQYISGQFCPPKMLEICGLREAIAYINYSAIDYFASPR
jgi:hypothetical protein